MPHTITDVLVFRTNIATRNALQLAGDILNKLPGISRWTVDMEDVDRVLRIEAGDICADEITTLLTHAGYSCTEL